MSRLSLVATVLLSILGLTADRPAHAAEQGNEFGGVGIILNIDNAALMVIGVVANAPAQRAGIRLGDRILKIGGEPSDIQRLAGNATRIRGKVGTDVVLTVSHPGTPHPEEITLRRESIHLPPTEQSSGAAAAQDFEVGKYGSWDGRTSAPGYYEVTDFQQVQDVAGNQHVICGGASIMAKDGLMQRLAQKFGSDEEAENKIVAYVKKVDAGKNGPRRCLDSSRTAVARTKVRFDAERVYASFVPFVFDFRRGMDVEQGQQYSHQFKFTFYSEQTDIEGKHFFVHDQDQTFSREDLRAQEADLEKKIRSPITNSNPAMVGTWRHDLAPIKKYLAKISQLELDPSRSEYLESKSSITIAAERDSDDTVDCDVMGRQGKCPRSSLPENFQAVTESRGMLNGTVVNHGDKMIVRLEVEVAFLNKSGKEVERRLYALPIDQSIGNLTENLPDEIFFLGPNSSSEFHIKVLHMAREWSGAVTAKLTGVTFADDYAEVLRNIRDQDQAAVQQWSQQGRDDQAAAYQRMIADIDSKLSVIAEHR